MEKLLLLLFFYVVLPSYSQQNVKDNKPTKEETQQWIKEKIASYSFDDGKTKHSYYTSFDQNNMIINEDLWMDISGHTTTSYTKIAVIDIDYIYTSEKLSTVWLTIKLKPGKREFTTYKNDNSTSDPEGKVDIILNKSFKDDNLPERMKKAFSRLIELYGGNKPMKETF